MKSREMLDRFEFDDQNPLYQEVDPQPLVRLHSVELEGDHLLSFDDQTPRRELARQHHFVDRFE